MKLIRKEFVFNTNGEYDWSRNYATGPVVDIIDDKIWRIYYATRDSFNHGRTTYIEVEAGNPTNILYIHDRPIFGLGKIGTFDDCGAGVTSILNYNGKKYLYYLGITVRNTISYHNSMGLAISEDGGKTFYKFSEGPLLSPTYKEPYGNGATYTLLDGDIFRLYYTSFVGWEVYNNHPEPLYNIKYAESKNGIDWERNQIISVDFKDGVKCGIAKPSVIKENGIYKMWYTYRGAFDYRTNKANSYRIGYGESKDGRVFTRMDEKFGMDIAENGWDSVMQTYPNVIKYDDKYWVFYNGNTFGKSGFGCAVFEK